MDFDKRFEVAFERLIGHEGGFTQDPRDPGNWTGGRVGAGKCLGTKYGIAANTYPDIDIQNLTLDQAKEIYYRDWWLKLGAPDFGPDIAYQVWDFAVNAGMGTARRALQRAARVADDGAIGPLTIAAVRRMRPEALIIRFAAERLAHYAKLSAVAVYGKGWMRRTAAMLDQASKDMSSLNLRAAAAAVGNEAANKSSACLSARSELVMMASRTGA